VQVLKKRFRTDEKDLGNSPFTANPTEAVMSVEYHCLLIFFSNSDTRENMTPEFQFIQTLPDLKLLCKQLSGEKLLGIDTEADSLYHYYPKVCLIQVSTTDTTFVVDPLSIETIEPLRPMFANRRIRKVFHGADYDVRSLFRCFGIAVNNLFDTMVASQFLGEREPSLAAVVKKRFGATLDKRYQKANWSKRPLSHNMILYAAHDSACLIRLYHALEKELKSKGRWSWVEEECETLSKECLSGNPVCSTGSSNDSSVLHGHGVCQGAKAACPPLFRRFKGAGKLAPRDLAVLEEVLQCREKIAMEKDRPPFKIFSNRMIQKLVAAKPIQRAALEQIRNLPPGFMNRYADGVLEAVKKGLALPRHSLPTFPKTRRAPQDPKKQARLKRLKGWRGLKAGKLDMEPGLICNNALLHAFAEHNPKDMDDLKAIEKMRVWQRKTFGQEIIGILQDVRS
jgi:ribonuclease D